jgi:hypothetical protein
VGKWIRDPQTIPKPIDEQSELEHGDHELASVLTQHSSLHELRPSHGPGLARPGPNHRRVLLTAAGGALQPIMQRALSDSQQPGGLRFAEDLAVKDADAHEIFARGRRRAARSQRRTARIVSPGKKSGILGESTAGEGPLTRS